MSTWDKLLKQIRSLSRDIRFAELKKVLEKFGYEGRKPARGSSHWTFRKKGCAPITVPEDEPIKIAYVKIIKEVVENETDNQKGL